MAAEERIASRLRTLIGYGAMIVATVAVYQLIIRKLGRGLKASAPAAITVSATVPSIRCSSKCARLSKAKPN